MKDLPSNSSLAFEYLLPFPTYFEQNRAWLDSWGNNNIRTFLLLKEGVDVADFSKKFKDEVRAHNKESTTDFFVQPFSEAYLYGNFADGKQNGGRIEYVRIFFIVAIFVLVIACINFMNLSTAQASRRAKEVGLRKVIGALPRQLFRQFMGESFITVVLAAAFAFLVAALVIPAFNELTGKSLSLNLLDIKIVGIFVGLIIATSLLAGSYPAIFISEFKPVQVLKGQLKSGKRASVFRKTLVVVQFVLSIFLIVSTIVVYRQMDYMQNRDLGFVRDNLFYTWMEGDMGTHYETIRTRLLQSPAIESVTKSDQVPIDVGNSTGSLQWEGKDPDESVLFSNINVDFDFIQTMKMTMAEGRTFDRNIISDTVAFIVNEKGAEKFGFEGDTAGKELTFQGRKGKIIGVVRDFNFWSLHDAIEPFIMAIQPKQTWGCVIVRAKEGQSSEAIAAMEKLSKEYAPAYP
jgi:hypothetical protein